MDEQTPEVSTEGLAPNEDAEMGALFDKLTAEGVEDQEKEPEAAEPAPEAGSPDAEGEKEAEADEKSAESDENDEEKAEEPEPVAAPSDLPRAIREVWGTMSPEAQQAVQATQRELSQRMAEQGRVVQVAKPVYDSIVEAARDLPEVRDMTPAQLAQEALSLVRTRASLQRDPVGTIMDVAKHYGAIDALRAQLGGGEPNDMARANIELVNEVRSLKQQIAQLSDPSKVDERIDNAFAQRSAMEVVTEFQAAHKDTWDAVQDDMIEFIPIARKKLGDGASEKDVLSWAYERAIDANPDLRAKTQPPAKPQAPDPERTAAQVRAKSVNVPAKSSGKPKPLTERQAMEAVWDRAVQS